jgi:hypothetical protein
VFGDRRSSPKSGANARVAQTVIRPRPDVVHLDVACIALLHTCCAHVAIWPHREYDPRLIASIYHGRQYPKQPAKTSRKLVVRVLPQAKSTMRRKYRWATLHKLPPRWSPMCLEGTFEKVRGIKSIGRDIRRDAFATLSTVILT